MIALVLLLDILAMAALGWWLYPQPTARPVVDLTPHLPRCVAIPAAWRKQHRTTQDQA